jgi:zinc protease
LDILLALLSEALRQPAFPPEQVERLRSQMLTSLAIRAQDTAEMASLAFDELAYPNHPYRRPEAGFPETVQAILPEDLAAFHSLHYGPDGMLIAIVGGIDPRQAIDKVRLAVEDWHNPHQLSPPPLPPLQPLVQLSTRHIPIPGKSQSDLVLGAPGPPRLSPDFMAASLGNHILGRFGMMGRLGEALREKTGLAYYAGSSLSGGLGPGPWEISAGVDPLNLDRALDLVRAEIRRFVNEPVGAQELADSQANYIGRLPISMESNAGLASALLALERFQLGLDHYLHYPDLVAEVTPVRILEAARRYLDPDRLAIATAGP